jgi:two-component sensor histidine kinase
MIAMQSRELDDPAARAQLAAAEARVIAMAKVHNRLYRSERVDRLEFKGYLEELCADLVQSLALDDKGGSLVCRSVAHDLPADQIVPLGIIVSELVTNAVKHAHGDGAGRIEVSFDLVDGRGRLTVSDDGVGIPDGFDPTAQPGLGMKVVRALVRQVNGEMTVSRLDPGSRFVVLLSAEAPSRSS